MNLIKILVLLLTTFVISGCMTANQGAFIPATYIEDPGQAGTMLGEVTGQSRQRWFLYLIPIGDAPSTQQAIAAAKAQREGTRYLTDVIIEERTEWQFGYSEQVIEVNAIAYR
ncbi:hypothetical protein [Thalassotalea mangrovi]|uniref:Lipoprotein n=1 Tax=Thalassotalea mangrovi TaxID=2572245 RepID=A0A4U1B778_9GAMM|nr:hypothetical protein [Thalassotalea mangrovi]TKB46361.1 hypothetical protein E8M12_04725 [Thalassotalea mangrovi]